MDAALRAKEFEIEGLARDRGAARYYASVEKGEERTRAGRDVLKLMTTALAGRVAEWIQTAHDGKASRNAGLALFLGQFKPEDVAFITARQVLASFSSGCSALTTNAIQLANRLEDASMSDLLRQDNPKAWHRLQGKISRSPFPGKRYILVKRALKEANIMRITWTLKEKTRLGIHLIEECASTSGMFEIAQRVIPVVGGKKKRYKTALHIDPFPETVDSLAGSHEKWSLLSPQYMPMVVPPLAWTGMRDGGYLNRKEMRCWMIANRGKGGVYTEMLNNAGMPMVYESLNAIQATPWRINKYVHRVMRSVWDNDSTLGKLPKRDMVPLPAQPWGDGEAPDKDSLNEHNARVARIREANEKAVSKRLAMDVKLTIAGEFETYDAIYFPHVVDRRGRIYPLPTYVNPQSDDSGRALLEFAAGYPLGEEGAYWLAVHGANTFGFDKAVFDERVAWVEQHQTEIRGSATDAFNHRFWTQADDPYMFLAFCCEWAQLQDWVATGAAQDDFLSRLPVSWDGSCNGLQNFSAILRDPIGGAATNLIPSAIPADIYQRVADVASERVRKDAADGEVNAVYWLGKVTRKIAKRPTMTLPYGSGRFGFRDQLIDELQKIKADTGEPHIKGDEFLCSMYLANVMYDALGKVVVAARTAMDWLREAARIAAAEGLPIYWRTPAGFIAYQDYLEQIGQVASCTIAGRRFQVNLTIDSNKIDKRKQAQGISPNFVHSLDAAHLMRTVSMCVEHGIEDFAMVHDSYGTHAGNAALLRRCLQQAFVDQYSSNVLEDLREQLMAQVPEKVRAKFPPVPPLGDLDLTAVLQSEYFFA